MASDEMLKEIYPGSSVTVLGAYCLLMAFKRLCKVPFSTMVVLLNLLQLLCPAENLLPKNKYQLVKFAQRSASKHTRIDFCRSCRKELQRNKKCSSGSCPNTEPNTLIMISPESALQRIISGMYTIMVYNSMTLSSMHLTSHNNTYQPNLYPYSYVTS